MGPSTLIRHWMLAIVVGCVAVTCATHAQEQEATTVGMSGQLEQVVIPGPKLQPRPVDDEAPLVLRIVEVFPHGESFRYDFSWYGLEPGEYNLLDFLQHEDGTAASGDPIMVTVRTVLPPGQVLPHELPPASLPSLGGYRTLLIVAGVVWCGGLLLILFWGRGSRREAAAARKAQTLSQRLRPLVENAMAGKLSGQQQAELEMALVVLWRRRLQFEELPASETMSRLREHEEAGPLLRQLEAWLHQPADRREQVDVSALLRPYENLPANALTDRELPSEVAAQPASVSSGEAR